MASIRLFNLIRYGASRISHTAQLVEAVKSWPRDLDSIAQRSTASSLVKRLDNSLAQAIKSLQETEPKYFRGESTSIL